MQQSGAPPPVSASTGVEVELDEDGEPILRKFELCHIDANGEIDECVVVYENDLEELVGTTHARAMLDDPVAQVFFSSQLNSMSELPEGVQGTIGTAPTGERYFTIADWQVRQCVANEECKLPDDIILRAMGPQAIEQIAPHSVDRPRRTRSRFHLHFGAGRLGMGLVVPAVSSSGIPFAVVQRPKKKWQDMFAMASRGTGEDQVDIRVNENVVVHRVNVFAGSEGLPEFMPAQSLIFASDPDELEPLVASATSFSCSLGAAMSKVLLPVLSRLPLALEDEKQPLLFTCENDHDAVARLQKELAGRVRVVDCMVDRVCTGRTVTPDAVTVHAEPWRGSIVPLTPGIEERSPFSSAVATLPRSQSEADYLSERKFSMVNGMHTVLAFMTLCQDYRLPGAPQPEKNSPAPAIPADKQEYVLLKYSKMPREQQLMCEAWVTLRAAQLLSTYGADSLMAWHGARTREEAWDVLLEYGEQVLEARFSQVDDVVSRVLGGGVANRWLTRLKPTQLWASARAPAAAAAAAAFDATAAAAEAEPVAFFKHATARFRQRALKRGYHRWVEPPFGSGEEARSWLADRAEELVLESKAFCKREVEITHKALIREQRKAGGKANSERVQRALQRQKAEFVELQESRSASKPK